jgi:uncharacterized protein YggE
VAQQTVLSVRGEARRMVAPDYATFRCGLRGGGSSKSDALELVRQTQDAIVDALAQLGGTALTPETGRAALTWSVGTMSTHPVRKFDKGTGRSTLTGRVRANAALLVVARDLALIDSVGQALKQQDRLHIQWIGWGVDEDNPQWRTVRADAIAAAIAKGSDYAVALGGSVRSVEHIADVGLLSGDPADHRMATRDSVQALAPFSSGGGRTPSLDPVPQELHAVIEARLVAEVPTLTSDAT